MTTVIREDAVPESAVPRRRVRDVALRVFSQHLIWPLLAVVFLIGTTVEGFLQTENLLNIAWAAAPLGLMTLGMFFVMITGGLDLSLESMLALAPTLAVLLVTAWMPDLPVVVAIAFVLLVGLVVGGVNGTFSVKLGVNPFLVTLATLLIMRGLVIYLIPEGVYGLPAELTYLGGARVGVIPVAVLVLLLVYAIGHVVVNRTAFGKSIYAIGNNERAAYIAGINVDRVKMIAFVLAGVCAAIGGLLEVGRLDSVVADLGQGDILLVFAAATLGGTSLQGGEGRVTGVLGAVLLIAAIDNLMNLVGVDPAIRQVVFGVILLAAIYVASLEGRFGKKVVRA